MTTQTPRTDEAQYAPFPNIDPDELVVSVVVARQLERELAAANEKLARLRDAIEPLIETAEEKLAYVLSAYGPEFRNKAKELKAEIAAGKEALRAEIGEE